MLESWNDGGSKSAIVDFVERVTDEDGAGYVAREERVAVFDNDGTLWCEQPMPIELGFVLERLAAMAADDADLRERQPWKAAAEGDHAWLGGVITKHYHGDDADLKVLMGGMLQAFAGWTVHDYTEKADGFLRERAHPTLARPFLACGYLPMIELLAYLEAHGFTNYIASGGDRDFMRPVTTDMYAIPPERVIGSSNQLRFEDGDDGGSLVYLAEPETFDDGPTKPIRIWSRIGRRPLIAGGNSNGDIPMLRFAGGPSLPALRLLVVHDDADREFAYTAGAEQAVEQAAAEGWTTVSVRDDWAAVFADVPSENGARGSSAAGAGR